MDYRSAIRNAMLRQAITQAKLSEMSGVTQATISRTLTGVSAPEWGTVRKLFAALGITHPDDQIPVAPPPQTSEPSTDPLTQAICQEVLKMSDIEKAELLYKIHSDKQDKPEPKKDKRSA